MFRMLKYKVMSVSLKKRGEDCMTYIVDNRFMYRNVKPIPITYGSSYQDARDKLLERLYNYDQYIDNSVDVIKAVIHSVDSLFLEGGLDKATIVLACTLYAIEKGYVGGGLAYDAYRDVVCVKSGRYDHLLSDQDLELMREDISKIREYFNRHPLNDQGFRMYL